MRNMKDVAQFVDEAYSRRTDHFRHAALRREQAARRKRIEEGERRLQRAVDAILNG